MKKRIRFLLIVVCILALSAAILCACDNTDTPNNSDKSPVGGNNGNGNNTQIPDDTEQPKELKVYFRVGNGEAQEMQFSEQNGVKFYTITRTLAVGNRVSFYDSKGVTFSNYDGDFDGVIKIDGEYVFTLKITGTNAIIFVKAPQPPEPEELKVFFKVSNDEAQEMQFSEQNGTKIYTITRTLSVGDHILFSIATALRITLTT